MQTPAATKTLKSLGCLSKHISSSLLRQGMGTFQMKSRSEISTFSSQSSEKRVAIFIDGNNFYFGLRKLYGKNKSLKTFDFEKFAHFLAGKDRVVAIHYYNAMLDREHNPKKYESQKEFFEKLRKIPNFHLVLCKLLKRNIT